jgi:hypothetical protein
LKAGRLCSGMAFIGVLTTKSAIGYFKVEFWGCG